MTINLQMPDVMTLIVLAVCTSYVGSFYMARRWYQHVYSAEDKSDERAISAVFMALLGPITLAIGLIVMIVAVPPKDRT